jgi:hypothetical protein
MAFTSRPVTATRGGEGDFGVNVRAYVGRDSVVARDEDPRAQGGVCPEINNLHTKRQPAHVVASTCRRWLTQVRYGPG